MKEPFDIIGEVVTNPVILERVCDHSPPSSAIFALLAIEVIVKVDVDFVLFH